MAKPVNKYMGEIITKYRTGQYKISELARTYGVDKSTISRFIKNNNVVVIQRAKNKATIEGDCSDLNQRNIKKLNINQRKLDTLNQIVKQTTKDVIVETTAPPIRDIQDLDNVKTDEIPESVKKETLEFAEGFKAVGLLILQKSIKLLQNENVTAYELTSIAKATQIINDTLNIFPKAPTIAQQININEKNNNDSKEKKIDLEIKFV